MCGTLRSLGAVTDDYQECLGQQKPLEQTAHFVNEETATEKASELLKTTQLMIGSRIQT